MLRSFPAARQLAEYDGVPVAELEDAFGSPLLAFSELPSTQDAAHILGAEGAPSGTVVVAERQSAGRGRQGKQWQSGTPSGVWVTRLDRPDGREALGVLSLRLGLMLAAGLEPFADSPVMLKWPNDIHLASGKLAGILVEARWRDERPEWVAAGVGVNVSRPQGDTSGIAGCLRDLTSRSEVLRVVVAALAEAVGGGAVLASWEMEAWAARDMAAGARCVAPMEGIVLGISADGALRLQDADGVERTARAGSLQLVNDHSTRENRR